MVESEFTFTIGGKVECRSNCAACCIAPSIHSAIPNMPDGKKAGEYCQNLDPITLSCVIWGDNNYPELCRKFLPCQETCGENREQALTNIAYLELVTAP
jgi:hypothetical protein